MKKIWKRLVAYAIDMMVVLVVAQSISGIPAINKQLSKYNKYYGEYTELVSNYTNFKVQLNQDFKDQELTEEEYEKLAKDYSVYKDVLEEYYQDEKLTEREYDSIIKKIDEDYQEQYQTLYYRTEQNSTFYMGVYLATIILYFVVFNKITNGQTLGKRIVRLKIVNSKDVSCKVPVWSYLVRACFLYQPINYLIKLVGIYTLSQSNYYTVTSVLYDVQYYLELIIMAMVLIRADGRGLHDLVARTRVALYDKNGNEIEDTSLMLGSKKLTTKKKIIENQE